MNKNISEVEFFGLNLDENNLELEVANGNKYWHIPTNYNIRDIFKETIEIVLRDYKVTYRPNEIEKFLDGFMISNIDGIAITEWYTGIIDVGIEEYLKNIYKAKVKRKSFIKIDMDLLSRFIEFDLKRIAVNVLLENRLEFICYYAVLLNQKVKIQINGENFTVYRVNKKEEEQQ